MKYVLILITSFTMLKGCSQGTTAEKPLMIRYEASSRGYFYSVSVDPNSIMINNDRGGSGRLEKATTKNEWEELLVILKEISLENLDDMDTPTEKRAADRAAMATLEIKYPTKSYISNTFDHGNPPATVRTLVDKLLQMAETVERQ